MDLPKERHKVLQGAPEAINAPRRDHVELTPRCALQHAVEGWALVSVPGAADPVVAVLVHDLPATALGYGQQLSALVLHALTVCAHPGVDRDPLGLGHAGSPVCDWRK